MVRSRVIAPDDPAYEGQRHYTPAFLRIYDVLVLAVFCPAVWRCPTERLVEQYERWVGPRHLDVGPGTGSLLRRATLPAEMTLTLLDPNPNVLAFAARRLASRAPHVVEADVLKPLPVAGPFDSVALSNVLHCLPGPMERRGPAIANVASVLAPQGTLFGSTVLGDRALHTRFSHLSMRNNVRLGVFDNVADDAEGLHTLLSGWFGSVEVELVGSVALFRARGPAGVVDR